eukprot:scaffold7704_cov112-Isochrysis_galbana.AAC.13
MPTFAHTRAWQCGQGPTRDRSWLFPHCEPPVALSLAEQERIRATSLDLQGGLARVERCDGHTPQRRDAARHRRPDADGYRRASRCRLKNGQHAGIRGGVAEAREWILHQCESHTLVETRETPLRIECP